MTEDKKADWKFRYNKYKLLHKCVKCGKQDAFTLRGKSTCAECTEIQRKCDAKRNALRSEEYKEKKRLKRLEAKENGMCTRCYKRKAAEGYTECEKCRNVHIRYNRRKTLNNGKLSASEAYDCGLCMQCRKKPHMEGRKQCPECYEKAKQTALAVLAKRNHDNHNHIWRAQNNALWGGNHEEA